MRCRCDPEWTHSDSPGTHVIYTMFNQSPNEIIHGPNVVLHDVTGWSIGHVKQTFRDALNLSYFAEAFIDGRSALVSELMAPGQRLEFLRRFGFKGSHSEPREVLEARGLLRSYPEIVQIVDEVRSLRLTHHQSEEVLAARLLKFFETRFGQPPRESLKTMTLLVSQLSEELARSASIAGPSAIHVDEASTSSAETTSVAGVLIDQGRFTVRCGGQTCFLGNTNEYRLLVRLHKARGDYVSYSDLIEDVWGGNEVKDRTIHKAVHSLRRKLRNAGLPEGIIIAQTGYYALRQNY